MRAPHRVAFIRRRIGWVGLVLGALATPLAAQSGRGNNSWPMHVPAQFADADASGVALWALAPFEARRQVLLSAVSLGDLSGQQLVGLAVRRNLAVGMDAVGGRLHVRIEVSETSVEPRDASPRFRDNGSGRHGTFDGIISLPDRPAFGDDPVQPGWDGDDAVRFEFSRPLALRGGLGLCIESVTTQVLDANGEPERPYWPIDAVIPRFAPVVQDLGGNCLQSDDPMPAGVASNTLVPGSTARFHLSTPAGPARTAVLNLGLGLGSQGFDLSGLGAPGCISHLVALSQWNQVLAPLPAPGRRNLATSDLWLPNVAALSLLPLRVQWLVLDSQANDLGVQTSNAFEFRLPLPIDRPATWIESTDPRASSGQILAGRQPVFELILR